MRRNIKLSAAVIIVAVMLLFPTLTGCIDRDIPITGVWCAPNDSAVTLCEDGTFRSIDLSQGETSGTYTMDGTHFAQCTGENVDEYEYSLSEDRLWMYLTREGQPVCVMYKMSDSTELGDPAIRGLISLSAESREKAEQQWISEH